MVFHFPRQSLVAVLTLGAALSVLPHGARAAELSFTTLPEPVVFDRRAGTWLARADFNGDGLDDLLLGGTNHDSLKKTPLSLLLSNGDGTLTDASRHLPRRAAAASPRAVARDFTGDGRVDVVVFDAGNQELGQDPDGGGFYGEKPHLLLARPGGRFKYSNQLAKAVAAAKREIADRDPGAGLHMKTATAADVDLDGDLDVFVEAGGGFQDLKQHFLINRGNGRFDVDYSKARFDRALTRPGGAGRFIATLLTDLDGDGFADLAYGQHRRPENDQEKLRSLILFNDGAGRFPGSTNAPRAVLKLRAPAISMGYTSVASIAAGDVDGDGDPDLVLSHTRQDYPRGVWFLSRYLQVLVNRGGRRFSDQTRKRMGPQTLETAIEHPEEGANANLAGRIELLDVDADGDLDLFMGRSADVDEYAPLIYLNNGRGHFRAVDPLAITGGQSSFAENAIPIDLDGDGLIDFVHADSLPGADGEYGTADDVHQVISTLVKLEADPTQ